MIYICQDNQYQQYDRPSLECPEFSSGIPSDWTPTVTSLPCSLQSLPDDEYEFDQDSPSLILQPRSVISATFSDYLSELRMCEQNLFESLEMLFTCYE
jgi:hypothetical protein